jgi:hypothetical protein
VDGHDVFSILELTSHEEIAAVASACGMKSFLLNDHAGSLHIGAKVNDAFGS